LETTVTENGMSRPGKNWDDRILDPEEHFSKSLN
jgi:hypothetical protein